MVAISIESLRRYRRLGPKALLSGLKDIPLIWISSKLYLRLLIFDQSDGILNFIGIHKGEWILFQFMSIQILTETDLVLIAEARVCIHMISLLTV